MAKIVMIIGSPRKNSNSELIADKIAEGAKQNGYEIVKYKINDLKNVRGCQGCGACKKAGVCVQNDDIKPILEDIKVSDGVILATPEYFGQPTAQFRLAQDRMFSFVDGTFTPVFPAGKKCAVAVTCGTGYDGAVAMADQIEGWNANSVGHSVMWNGPSGARNRSTPEALRNTSSRCPWGSVEL